MSNGFVPYRVDPMHWEDVPAVMSIERQSFTLPWSDYTYRHELLENIHSHYFIARRIDQTAAKRSGLFSRWRNNPKAVAPIVGYGGFWLIADEAHISTIASHPDWRGRGVGELMLLVMIERALQLNAFMVTLEVRVTNEVAKNLYLKYGFDYVGSRPRYYRDNNEDADLMTVDSVQKAEYRQKIQALRIVLEDQLRRDVGQAGPERSRRVANLPDSH